MGEIASVAELPHTEPFPEETVDGTWEAWLGQTGVARSCALLRQALA